ncbi:MAG TPA: transposase [Verrucomicrobiae bacterium]
MNLANANSSISFAAITRHIPDKGAQMVRYYGWYSNKTRGVRQRRLPANLVIRRPGLSPPRR